VLQNKCYKMMKNTKSGVSEKHSNVGIRITKEDTLRNYSYKDERGKAC